MSSLDAGFACYNTGKLTAQKSLEMKTSPETTNEMLRRRSACEQCVRPVAPPTLECDGFVDAS